MGHHQGRDLHVRGLLPAVGVPGDLRRDRDHHGADRYQHHGDDHRHLRGRPAAFVESAGPPRLARVEGHAVRAVGSSDLLGAADSVLGPRGVVQRRAPFSSDQLRHRRNIHLHDAANDAGPNADVAGYGHRSNPVRNRDDPGAEQQLDDAVRGQQLQWPVADPDGGQAVDDPVRNREPADLQQWKVAVVVRLRDHFGSVHRSDHCMGDNRHLRPAHGRQAEALRLRPGGGHDDR